LVVSGIWSKDKLREVKNIENGKQINIIEFNEYHSLIATVSSGCTFILIWDYELLRLISKINFN